MKTYQVDKYTQRKLEQQHLKVQEEISNLPKEKRDIIRSQQVIVDTSLDKMNESFFDFTVDTFLIENGLSGSCRSELLRYAKDYAGTGKSFLLEYKPFIATHDNQIMHVDKYIYVLEKALINKRAIQITRTLTTLTTFETFKLFLKKLVGLE